jgi:hypothetical protein
LEDCLIKIKVDPKGKLITTGGDQVALIKKQDLSWEAKQYDVKQTTDENTFHL